MRSTTDIRGIRALFAGAAVVSGAGMVVFPLFPAIQDAHGISTSALGLIAGAGFVAAMTAEILIAPQADRGHARRMVLAAVAVMGVSLVLLALATDLWTLVASRALSGFSFGLFIAAASAMLVRSRPGHAGEQLGRLAVAELGGLAVGPMVAAGLLHWTGNVSLTSAVLAAAVVVALPVLAVALPASIDAPAVLEEGAPAAPAVPPLALDLLRSRAVVGAALLTVAVMIPTGAYDAIWPRYLADLGADDLLIGLSYTAFAIPYMLVATPAGRLADRVGGLAAAWRGMVLVVLMMTMYMWLRSPVPAAFVGLFESTGQAVAYTAASAAVARSVPLARAGSAQGLARAMGTLGATIVSFGSGPVYATGGPVPLFGGAIVLVLLTMVVATVLLRSAGRTPTGVKRTPVAAGQLQAT